MGLDMYLDKSHYVGGWNHSSEEEKEKYNTILKIFPYDTPCQYSPHMRVEICVAYWRKANQIHNWFVENVQGGRDECQTSYVSPEQLTELRDLCQELLVNKDVDQAMELLPPVRGFFFGSDEIDEWYWKGLEYTVEVLTNILKSEDEDSLGADYVYRSSW
jgi:hypothetical protein